MFAEKRVQGDALYYYSHKIDVFSFTLKPEVWGSREISVVAKWIHSVLSSSSTMFSQNKMISTILACVTDDFQNLEKCNILKMHKKSAFSSISSVLCFFVSDRHFCNNPNLDSIKTALKSIFSSKKLILAFYNPKFVRWTKTILKHH